MAGGGAPPPGRDAPDRSSAERLLLVQVDVLEVGAAPAPSIAEVDAVLEVEAAVSARALVRRFETVVYVDLHFQGGRVERRLEVEPFVQHAAGDSAAVDDGATVVGQVAATRETKADGPAPGRGGVNLHDGRAVRVGLDEHVGGVQPHPGGEVGDLRID